MGKLKLYLRSNHGSMHRIDSGNTESVKKIIIDNETSIVRKISDGDIPHKIYLSPSEFKECNTSLGADFSNLSAAGHISVTTVDGKELVRIESLLM